eukprot:CAMPEP_0201497358 /NCGR_PEP_ID=MMETSP0151_2-20130828/65230_1 /ASSEMBLY_ACC=CAM_ASM_000257 /TAXON_ID=200890 /ORGANISM="Paramoeba atlantica, Strain 621/1 / CCAP 1560/9" /LENGTH=73 /DNA_ID=CAMNT_0047887995 /DNA_START=96 /DNA_END=317 /DNA_ORIENTATION=-
MTLKDLLRILKIHIGRGTPVPRHVSGTGLRAPTVLTCRKFSGLRENFLVHYDGIHYHEQSLGSPFHETSLQVR